MKLTLAIDTATARTQFAILEGDQLMWQESEDGATTHGDVLAKFGELAARHQIDQVIVGMGPGPFTGLRTGIIFAQSFAFARGLKFHGVCSLDAIAFGIPTAEYPEFIVATDARRKELYWAKYVDGVRIGDPLVSAPSEIPDLPIFGEGAKKYALTEDIQNLFPKLIAFPSLSHVDAPMYLRRPDAVPTSERGK